VADELTKKPRTSRVSSPACSGPTNRTASISPDVNDPGARNIDFEQLTRDYAEAPAWPDGGRRRPADGRDVFDTLNAKAAIFAIQAGLAGAAVDLPLMISVTIPMSAAATLRPEPERVLEFHRPCAPPGGGKQLCRRFAEVRPFLEELSAAAECYFSAHLNAGLPNAFGEYDETPAIMAERNSATSPSVVSSTSPAAAAAPRRSTSAPSPRPSKAWRRARLPRARARLSPPAWSPSTSRSDSLFVNVGERTNVTGSARFKRLIKEGDYDTALSVARAGRERRPGHRRQHGRGHARCRRGHGTFLNLPPRSRISRACR
jgi:5-methyltetrahydrofolate--homocysteine methyltransferase